MNYSLVLHSSYSPLNFLKTDRFTSMLTSMFTLIFFFTLSTIFHISLPFYISLLHINMVMLGCGYLPLTNSHDFFILTLKNQHNNNKWKRNRKEKLISISLSLHLFPSFYYIELIDFLMENQILHWPKSPFRFFHKIKDIFHFHQ